MPGFPIITTTGDLLIGGIAGIETRLPGNTTEDRQFLMSVGDGDDASAPEWTTVAITDVDGLSTALSGKAAATHSHAISDITDLQSTLDGKASLANPAFVGSVTVNGTTPRIVLNDTDGSGTRPTIKFTNNSSFFFVGDGTASSGRTSFDFFALDSSTRASDAFFRIFGKGTSTWGNYIAFTHDGTNGAILTDVGNLILNPNQHVVMRVPSSEINSANVGNNQLAIWLDESGNKLKFKCKTSGGTVKTGEIALT